MRGWLAVAAMGSFVLAACSSGGSDDDAGVEAGVDSGAGDSGDDGSSCGVTLCIHGDQPPQCPSCAPSGGDICSPPAPVTCNYTNGCTGGQEESRQCTCVLPDAGADDAGDAGSSGGNAHWSCKNGA